ncbi:MAG: hypothetical protein HXY52_09000 [Nitrospirae bacterium]|jgi:hypothetical protein|nr:hypothetical protein [Nitrospirota bacterium]
MKNQIKYLQTLFYDLLNDYGRVYLIVKYSEKTIIGKRGFTEEEKKQGLILVFNQKNHRNLEWTDRGDIITTLGFGAGNRPENCFIYSDDIISVFSPDARIKLDRWDILEQRDENQKDEKSKSEESEIKADEKVVLLDKFRSIKK